MSRKKSKRRATLGVDTLQRRLRRAFPRARLDDYRIDFSRFALRFELGDEKPNGSFERIAQTVDRAVKLFEACNDPSDDVVLIHNEYPCGEIFPSRPLGYILTLIAQDPALRIERAIDEAEGEGEFSQMLYPTCAMNLAYAAIFRGIANCEQGRSPCIGGRVFIVNMTKIVVFYMYDDRGCLIFADNTTKLKRLYMERN